MAAKFEFMFVSATQIKLPVILKCVGTGDEQVVTKSLTAFKNWSWEDVYNLSSFSDIDECLEKRHIVLLDMYSKQWGDIGGYIYRVNHEYVYELWIDTAQYPVLDEDIVSEANRWYYDLFFDKILKFVSTHSLNYSFWAIGAEMLLDYTGSISAAVCGSRNVVAWGMKQAQLDLFVHMLKDFCVLQKSGENVVAYKALGGKV